MDQVANPSDLRIKALDIAKILSNQSPFNDLRVEIYSAISDIESDKIEVLKETIVDLIDQDPSHAITGTYTIDNITTRPENSLLLIGNLELLLNIATDQIIILENNAKKEAIHFLVDLITQLPEVFLYVSGDQLIEALEEIDYDNISKNVVFYHDSIDFDQLDEHVEQFRFVDVFDYGKQYSEEEIVAFCLAIWGYDMSKFRSLENPHIIVINDEKEVMGGARANAITSEFAVIGGVKVLQPFRNQGIGTAVSQVLTAKLVEMGHNPVLETDVDNFPAIRIYEKLGFHKVGRTIFLDLGTNKIEKIRGDRDY